MTAPLTDDQRLVVEANLGLVHHTLRAMDTPEHRYDDAFQDGVIGLMRASQLFDPARGFTFSTYARYWIRQGVHRGRARSEGVNFRRSMGHGRSRPEGSYVVEPLSLDHELTQSAEGTVDSLLDTLADDTDVEDAALRRIAAEDDHDAVLDVIGDDGLALFGSSVAAIAERLGCTERQVEIRRRSARRRLRQELATLGGAA